MAILLVSGCRPTRPAGLQVAVASNFAEAMMRVVDQYEANTGVRVVVSSGSTGKHFAQIRNGAPFDLFFAADAETPRLLENEGAAVNGSRITYAFGRLVLWSPRPGYVDSTGRVLTDGMFSYLAVANPDLAPYGRAAREVLLARGLWEALSDRIVRGENIGQTFQYVKSGNAEIGFVALSQIAPRSRDFEGSMWLVPDSLYAPIEQQAVLLKDSDTARAFLSFFDGPEARQIIQDFGYNTP